MPSDLSTFNVEEFKEDMPVKIEADGKFVESTTTVQKLGHLYKYIMTLDNFLKLWGDLLANAQFDYEQELWEHREEIDAQMKTDLDSLTSDERELFKTLFSRLKMILRGPECRQKHLECASSFGDLFVWPGSTMTLPEKIRSATVIKFFAFRIDIVFDAGADTANLSGLSMADSCEKGLEQCLNEGIPERYLDILDALIEFKAPLKEALDSMTILTDTSYPILEYGSRLSEDDKQNETLLWDVLVTLLKRENIFESGIFATGLITKYPYY